MKDISSWMNEFLKKLEETFGERVWFVGLQGSYSRGEATETSDIDAVVILDALAAEDIRAYNAMLDTLSHRELICGFLAGKAELLHWDPSDLFQFYYDTTPLQGSLDELLPRIDTDAVRRAIHMAACNIYHGCVHNMLHEKSEDILRALYKSASFAIQAIYFLEAGNYIRRTSDLLSVVSGPEQVVLETYTHIKNGGAVDFPAMSDTLFAWAGDWIRKLHRKGVKL